MLLDYNKKRKTSFSKIFQKKLKDPFVVKEGKFKFGQLKDPFYYSNWTEHSFLSDSKSKEIVGRTFNSKKIKYFVYIIVLAILLILSRAVWLQIIRGDHYKLLSEGNRLRKEIIDPNRGIIYDHNLNPLVKNKANFVLYIIPIDLPKDGLQRDNILHKLSAILDGDQGVVKNNLQLSNVQLILDSPSFYKIKESLSKIKRGSLKSSQPVFISDNIDYDKAMLLSLKISNWPGVFLSNKVRREYLYPGLGHILGYTGKINNQELERLGDQYTSIDYVGKIGLEYFWEKELKGKPGVKNIEVDALGRQKKIVNKVEAKDGYNLELSLDLDLQHEVESVLDKYLKKDHLRKASVIIMNPNNGEILSLLSLPTYDNNAFARGIDQKSYDKLLNDPDKPLFNRAISGEFPSGSTIKIIFATAALNEGIINENTSFLSTGGLKINQWFFPDWKRGGHGLTSVKKAIAQSVNTFFYYIGGGYGDFKGLGVDRLVKYSRLFGLGEKTGIDLYGEADGFIPTKKWKQDTKHESWYIGDTYHFAIGQGYVLVTPLQVANYTAVIANQGTLYIPHLVIKLLGKNNKVIKNINKKIIRDNFVSKKSLQIVKEGMRDAVTKGSARRLNSLPVKVAGKTGTAQWSTKHPPHAWFTGFAPYNNPQIVITVLVEEGNEGSNISASIAHDILDWYFTDKEKK